jgi:glycosyltransferase A (GT-A) superfamily protein (DUF2064 family)
MHITIIAKAPVAGRVKTRLCPPCSPQQAAAIAAAGIADTIDAIEAALRRRSGAASPVIPTLLLDGEPQAWIPPSWRVVPQRGDGLAERLRNGFVDLGPGAIIGMETPHVAGHLVAALADIAAGRDVLGPAEDGGYWAIGLCASTTWHAGAVFDGVPMSTSITGEQQLRRLERFGTPRRLPLARDLDDFADLVAVADSGRSGRLPRLAQETVSAAFAPTSTMFIGASGATRVTEAKPAASRTRRTAASPASAPRASGPSWDRALGVQMKQETA